MRENGLGSRVCDGVVDCPDFSDELYCDYCPEKHFHCGVGKRCIDKEKMCDSVEDCENGADEKGCCELIKLKEFFINLISFSVTCTEALSGQLHSSIS